MTNPLTQQELAVLAQEYPDAVSMSGYERIRYIDGYIAGYNAAIQAGQEREKKNESIKRCMECGNIALRGDGITYISDMEFELRQAKELILKLKDVLETIDHQEFSGHSDIVNQALKAIETEGDK